MNVFVQTPLKEITLSDSLRRVDDSAFNTSNPFYLRLKVNYLGCRRNFLDNVILGYDNNDLKYANINRI